MWWSGPRPRPCPRPVQPYPAAFILPLFLPRRQRKKRLNRLRQPSRHFLERFRCDYYPGTISASASPSAVGGTFFTAARPGRSSAHATFYLRALTTYLLPAAWLAAPHLPCRAPLLLQSPEKPPNPLFKMSFWTGSASLKSLFIPFRSSFALAMQLPHPSSWPAPAALAPPPEHARAAGGAGRLGIFGI